MGMSVAEAVRTLDDEAAKKMKRLIERGVKIPPQPRVLEELRKHLQRKEFDIRLLSRVINQDAGITAMLFKVVTSAAYKQHQPFETVEQILHAVGVRQTFNLVQAISLAAQGDLKKNPQVYEAFWARSQAVAQLAMLIADERIAVCNIFPDQAYLAGVFHDCGVLLLMQRFSSYCAEMHLGEPGRWVELAEEDSKFSADHCVVGYIVARHWHLPDFICDAIRYHHDIRELGMHASRTMVAILQLAVDIYYRDQRVANPEWEQVKDEVLPELGMSDDGLLEFVDVIIERFHAGQH
ncbi:histidine kinase [Dechloromonas denitrificans]|uniref:Histidine kinase n=1 Tax=Dechloromonas denitrificans TaxID=281362 RepID=A0A133XHF6_9RHOO|nr:HDOD domain-containing protein [Dechloromonas denitrificans]KXB30372.1 histidine kinase [Dechloromonas denitrificans]